MSRNWQAIFQSGGVGSPEWIGEMESLEADVASGSALAGVVNYDGTVRAGTGFTAGRNAQGWYIVTFTVPFAAPPAVLVNTLDHIAGYVYSAEVSSVVAGSFEVLTWRANVQYTGDGILQEDRNFQFVAFAV